MEQKLNYISIYENSFIVFVVHPLYRKDYNILILNITKSWKTLYKKSRGTSQLPWTNEN